MKKLTMIALLAYATISAQPKPTQRIEFEAPESYPEGVAYDKAANVFYVSSARTGAIGKVDRSGKYSVLYADTGLKSTYGLKVHPDGKRLYACVSDANYSKLSTPDTKKKLARLLILDIKTGKKLSDIDLSKLVPGEHFINDVAFDDKGNAYITDSFANAIYKVDSKGIASVYAKSELFETAGVGLNGIVWNTAGYLLASSTGKGIVFKVDMANPQNVTTVKMDQFFPGADGMLLNDNATITLVQNGGVNKIFKIKSIDNFKTAKVFETTLLEDRFAYPSTAAMAGNETWVVNANFSELKEGNNVPSKKFSIQQAVFKPIK